MGILDKIKETISGEQESPESQELAEEFADEIEATQASGEQVEGGSDDEEEEMKTEWKNEYQFFVDWVEEDGFMGGKDFAMKAMFDKVSKSERFRDRIQHGTQTINQVTQSMESMKELKGSDTDLREISQELEAASDALDKADDIAIDDEKMLAEFSQLGREVVGLMQTRWEGQAGETDVSMERSE